MGAALRSSSAWMEGLLRVRVARWVVPMAPLQGLALSAEHAVAAPSVFREMQDEGMACETSLEFSLRQVEVVQPHVSSRACFVQTSGLVHRSWCSTRLHPSKTKLTFCISAISYEHEPAHCSRCDTSLHLR